MDAENASLETTSEVRADGLPDAEALAPVLGVTHDDDSALPVTALDSPPDTSFHMFRPRLRRSLVERVLGGVCGGIGTSLGVSGWWVRAGWAMLAFTDWRLGLLLYLLLWGSIPAQRLSDLPPLVRPGELPVLRLPRPEGILLLGALAILVGVVVLVAQTGLVAQAGDLLAPLMLLILGLITLIKHVRGIE